MKTTKSQICRGKSNYTRSYQVSTFSELFQQRNQHCFSINVSGNLTLLDCQFMYLQILLKIFKDQINIVYNTWSPIQLFCFFINKSPIVLKFAALSVTTWIIFSSPTMSFNILNTLSVVCLCACVRVRVCLCACVCVRVCVCVCACWYGNNEYLYYFWKWFNVDITCIHIIIFIKIINNTSFI